MRKTETERAKNVSTHNNRHEVFLYCVGCQNFTAQTKGSENGKIHMKKTVNSKPTILLDNHFYIMEYTFLHNFKQTWTVVERVETL